MMRYSWKSDSELRNYDTYKLAVLLGAMSFFIGVWAKQIRWGSEVAVPGAAAQVSQAPGFSSAPQWDIAAFSDASDVGIAKISGKSGADRVLLLRDSQVIAEAVPTQNQYQFSMPLLDLMGGKIVIREVPGEATQSIGIDQAALLKQFGPNKAASTFDVLQDPTDDNKYWVRLKGILSSGNAVRMSVDGQQIGEMDAVGGRWETQLPFELVQGKSLYMQVLQGESPIGEPINIMSPPKAEQFAEVPYALLSPGDKALMPTGPTTFEGTAAAGTVVLIYVDKYVVGKAIAMRDGTWMTTARIKSPGPARVVKAVTVPFNGIPATPSNVHSVAFGQTSP